jgi:8-oxo-dGTP pyrophosphatase MutT (NUDIX family)
MNFPRLPDLLAARLAQPLAGPMIGSRFESRPRFGRRYDEAPATARQAAVLILLYPYGDRWHLPLTLRPAHLPDHAGQVSLPGGALEPGEDPADAAVREFHEELGAVGLKIRRLGRLSPIYVNVSNFRVEPWVGVAERRPQWNVNATEVEQLLEVPLEHLLDPAQFGSHQREYHGQPYTAPHFAWQSYRVWGATCMILGELVTLVRPLLEER